MWIIQPVLNVIVFLVLEGSASSDAPVCAVLNPLVYGIICFLAAMVLILLIFLFKVLIARHGINTHNNPCELTPVSPNDALDVHPPSVNGADDSSSTSSESPEGSLADVSSNSQRYVSLQDRRKNSDYINISEGVSSSQADLKNEKSCKDIDYVNVNEPWKEITIKGQKNCEDGTTSMSSDTSAESAVNYSTVVFTKM